jgi:NAD(P)-dependent dehydrogenase (short-subunit alcohol dehydrogenase family)
MRLMLTSQGCRHHTLPGIPDWSSVTGNDERGGVLVTAGAAGIGLAIVQSFLAQGYRVATCDIDADAVQQLRAEYPDVAASTCDVSDDHAVRQWVDDAVAALGRTVVLVSDAGIAGPTAEVADLDLADWSRVIDVNLTGAFLVARAAIPHLRRQAEGPSYSCPPWLAAWVTPTAPPTPRACNGGASSGD